VKIEFDPAKSARNARERGLPFELTADLDWLAARVWLDQRRDCGEERYLALVPMTGRLYAVCYCVRSDVRRIISFRKAKRREERLYAKIFD
jgi:uncharacterized protein